MSGEVDLTAGGVDLEGKAVTFAQACLVKDLGLRAGFDAGGALLTSWARP